MIGETKEIVPDWRPEAWHPPAIDNLDAIPKGDMPGDRIIVNPESAAKSRAILPRLMDALVPVLESRVPSRAVVSVYGGSGSGKSVVGSLLAFYLNDLGIGAYVLSGDNYPRRIPRDNDRERLWTFRECGIKGLVSSGEYTDERRLILQDLQHRGLDASAALRKDHPWLAAYQSAGRAALEGYLGTPREIDFEEVNGIVARFKAGSSDLMLKRMGREEHDLRYERVSVAGKRVLLVEWTHGNSDWLRGIDLPVYLDSNPRETLEYRKSRARDAECDSPFTEMVLDIEQRLLIAQAPKAKFIVARNGEILSLERFQTLSGKGEGRGA
jgi:alpha-galactosidase